MQFNANQGLNTATHQADEPSILVKPNTQEWFSDSQNPVKVPT